LTSNKNNIHNFAQNCFGANVHETAASSLLIYLVSFATKAIL